MNDRPRANETGVFVFGWLGSLSKRITFPFFAAWEGSFSISLSPSLVALFPRLSFSDRRINRWRNEVFKQVEYRANLPLPSHPPKQPPIRCGRKEESVAQAATARYVEQERNYYRRVTYSDVLPLVESSHILHHALGTMAWPQERFPYYANASTLPCSMRVSPRLASLYILLNRRIGYRVICWFWGENTSLLNT